MPASPRSRRGLTIDEKLTSQMEQDSSAKSGLYAYRIPSITLKNFGYQNDDDQAHHCEFICVKTGLAGGDLFDRSCRDEVLKLGPEMLPTPAKTTSKIPKSFGELIEAIESLAPAENNEADDKFVANLYITLFQSQGAVSFEHEFASSLGLPLGSGFSAHHANIYFAGENSKGQPKASLGPTEWVATPKPAFLFLQGLLRQSKDKDGRIPIIPSIIDYCCFATLLTSQFCHFSDYWKKDAKTNEDVIKKVSQYKNLVSGEVSDIFDQPKLGRSPPGDDKQETLASAFFRLRSQPTMLFALRTLLAMKLDVKKEHENAFLHDNLLRLPSYFGWCLNFKFDTSLTITDDHGVVLRSCFGSDENTASKVCQPISTAIDKFLKNKVHENLNDDVNRFSAGEWSAFCNLAELDLMELDIDSRLKNDGSDSKLSPQYPRIRRIDDSVFRCCKQLSRLELELNELKTIGDLAFSNIEHLSFLSLKSDSLTKIGDNFCAENKNCKIVVKAEKLVSIGDGCFSNCFNVDFNDVDFSGVKTIGNDFMNGCSVTSSSSTAVTKIVLPSITKIGNGFFSECEGFEAVLFNCKNKSEELEIGSEFFAQSSINNVEVKIDASASGGVMIDESAFYGKNANFGRVQIDADNLCLVGKRFFSGCSVKSIEITSKKLDDFSFFTDVTNDAESIKLCLDGLKEDPFNIDQDVHYENVFNNRNGMKSLYLRSKTLQKTCTNFCCKCDALEEVFLALPALTNIGSKNFSRCPNLVSLRITGKLSQTFAPKKQLIVNDLDKLQDIDSSFCSSLNDDAGLELIFDRVPKLNDLGTYFAYSTAFEKLSFLIGTRQEIEKVSTKMFCSKVKKFSVKRGDDGEEKVFDDSNGFKDCLMSK